MSADQSQTPEATPRPWRMWGMQLRASTCPERCADFDHSILLADFYTERDGHPRTFDLDLTITAVNAYDRLRRNRACVNPSHMEPVTNRENILRGIGPAAKNAVATHCVNGHPFTEENTWIKPSTGDRVCRTCKAGWFSKWMIQAAGRTISAEEHAWMMTDAMILRSLAARYLDDDGDGYGGVPFISLDEAIRALTTDREQSARAALEEKP